jgi:hypothetical protein
MTRAPRQTENNAPYDLAGGSVTSANPFDTGQLADGPHIVTAAIDLTTGGTQVVHSSFMVANAMAGGSGGDSGGDPVGDTPSDPPSPTPGGPGTHVAILGDRFYVNGTVTYPGALAEGQLLNIRVVNSVFEDTNRPHFDPEANTDEFLGAMPSYIASGVRAFNLSLQGGNPGYEGARNTAINHDGSLKQSYLDRVERVIRAADAQGAVIILQIFYFRQDEYIADETAVHAAVVNVCNWIAAEGFTNLLLEIANEYAHGFYDHGIIRTSSGQVSLINLAKASCPASIKVSTSGLGLGVVGAESNDPAVIAASDYLTIHFNNTVIGDYAARIAALRQHGKPIVVNEDPKEGSSGAAAAQETVEAGASWGYFRRANQDYPFTFLGASEDPAVYDAFRRLATP